MRVFPKNLSLRQLRAFDEVACQGAFAPAARQLCMTQSALSESVRQLEEALGARLFDRTTRTVGLTVAGQAFLQDVRQVFELLEQGVQQVSDMAALRHGKVRIAAAPSVLAVMLMPVIPRLRAEHPGIELDLVEDSAQNIALRVREGTVDFGVGAAHPDAEGLVTEALVSDQMGIIARQDHPLMRKRHIALTDLAASPFVGLTTDTAISQLLAHTPEMPANVLQTALRVSNPSLLFEAIRLGLGFSIVPALTARLPACGDLRFRLLKTPRIMRRTSLMQRPRRTLSPAAQMVRHALIMHVQQLARSEGVAVESAAASLIADT